MGAINSNDFGVFHLADNPRQFQPVRQNTFLFTINWNDLVLNPLSSEALTQYPAMRTALSDKLADLDGTNGTLIKKSFEPGYFTADELDAIQYTVKKFDEPHISQTSVSVKRGNGSVNYAGAIEYKAGTLEIVDYEGADGKSILLGWQRLNADVDKTAIWKIYSSALYKQTCTVYEYMPDGTPIRGWTYYGCFVESVSGGGFNAEAADIKSFSATIKYDYALPIDMSSAVVK